MPDATPVTAADADALPAAVFQVPKDTTPTWEVELLLSGALVFSMLQVPGLLDDLIYSVRPRLTGSLNYGAFMLYIYLKVTSYALICTFVLHLASRAIWVAALGLRSVYPEGVLWDKLARGPIYREYAQRTTPTLDQMIDRADNRASLVFAFGLLLVLMSLAIMLFTMLLVAISALLGQLLPDGHDGTWLTLGLVLLLVLPMTTATLIDRRYGARLPPTHWLAGAMRAAYRVGAWLIWGPITNPILLTVFSRIGIGRGNLLMLGALYSLMAVIMLEILVRGGVVGLPGERYLADLAPARELHGINYADGRSQREALEGAPFIPAEYIADPYLRLFVPYLPRRVDAMIARDCPAATAAITDLPEAERDAAVAARTDALLACAAATLHPVSLDGAPIEGLRYDIGQDSQSGMRGFVAMIDVRDLPRGRHQLSVSRPAREQHEEAADLTVIPFWR